MSATITAGEGIALSKALPLDMIEDYICSQTSIDELEEIEILTEVNCEESAKVALSMALQSRKIEKNLEEIKKEITKPHLDFQRAVNKIVNGIKAKLDHIENSLKAKLEAWIVKEGEDSFEPTHLKVDDGSMSTTEEWSYEIENDAVLPRKFLKPDADAIESAIKKGMRNIEGLKIYKTKKLSLRIKN